MRTSVRRHWRRPRQGGVGVKGGEEALKWCDGALIVAPGHHNLVSCIPCLIPQTSVRCMCAHTGVLDTMRLGRRMGQPRASYRPECTFSQGTV